MITEEIVKQDGPVRLHQRVQQGFRDFMHQEASGSIVLLIATVLALILANSPLSPLYFAIWEVYIGLQIDGFTFSESFLHWINDFLMALFFLVIGLEIKREIVVGELSSFRQAILPLMAAVGGMLVPALIYLSLTAGTPATTGWGVPMATDIAFVIGVLALLKNKIPASLNIFLIALAIVDDIGAILVIALFYTSDISWEWLAIGGGFLLVLVAFSVIRVRSRLLYALVALGVWFAIYRSGVHATIAGVLVAFTIPTWARLKPLEFVKWSRQRLEEIESLDKPGSHVLDDDDQQEIAAVLQRAARSVQSPLQYLQHGLHPVTTFVILPLFALANAGIILLNIDVFELLLQPVSIGVFTGLVIGKQIGITLFSFLVVKLGLASLPEGVSWKHLYGVSWLAGIGFTMSLFISGLAFTDSPLLAEAKLAILIGSLVSGIGGTLVLYWANRDRPVKSTGRNGREV